MYAFAARTFANQTEGILKVLPAVITPYLIGVATAPLIMKIVKPIVRGTVKASVGLAIEAKKAAAEVGEEYRHVSAEASADLATKSQKAAEVAGKDSPGNPGAGRGRGLNP